MVKLTMIARVTDGLPLAEGLDDGRDMQDADFYKQQVKSLFKNLSRGQNDASRMSLETGPYKAVPLLGVDQKPDLYLRIVKYDSGFLLFVVSEIQGDGAARSRSETRFVSAILSYGLNVVECDCVKWVRFGIFAFVVSEIEGDAAARISEIEGVGAITSRSDTLLSSKFQHFLAIVGAVNRWRVCYLTMCDRAYPKKLAFQYLEDLKNEFERGYGNQIETAARPYAFIKFDTFIQRTKKLYQDTRTQRNISKLNDELYEVHQIMTRNVQEVLGVGEKLDQVSQMSSRLTSDTRIYADKARDLNRQALIKKWAPVAIVLGVVFLLFWARNKIW
ncbi:25.3 kDa vesicle transport protein [Tanacetum coccineum]